MILIGFNHRGIGAIGAGLFNVCSRGHLKLASTDASIDRLSKKTCWPMTATCCAWSMAPHQREIGA
jgi:hypothetical protein